jgi:hypothetical protein
MGRKGGAMKTPSQQCHASGEAVPREERELIVDLAGFDSAIECLDCLAGIAANLAAAQQVLHCCRRLELHLLKHLPDKEQINVATAARINPEYADFARNLKLEHEQLCSRLAGFSRAVQELEAVGNAYEAVRRIKEEGRQLAEQIGRHLAVERSQLAEFL